MSPTLGSVLKVLRRAIIPLIALSFGLAVAELWRLLRAEPIEVNPWGLLASGLALGAGYCVLALTFARVLSQATGTPQPRIPVFEMYFRGTLARYLPGKVGLPAVRMAAAPDFQVSPAFMAGTVVLETLASVATSCAIAAAISMGPWAPAAFRGITDKPWALSLMAAVVVGVALLAVIDLRHYPTFARRLLRSQDRVGALLSVSWLVGCAFSWLCVALSSALCARALGEGNDIALLCAAGGVLGPVVGFVAVVAPGGLGVREAFLVALLAPQVGTTRALAYALVSRAVTLGAELVLWLVSRAVLMLRSS